MASPYQKSPPPAPADAEVVRNIEVLAAFVAKAGVQFEHLARAKTANDPKFGFLLDGSPPGSEAARAHAFYQWKKQRLEQRVFASDGSDDLQLKICAMVDGDSKCRVSSDTHAMDSVKTGKRVPPGAADERKSAGSTDGVRKAETLQIDDSIRKSRSPLHHKTRDDMKPSQSTAPHKKKSELDRSKHEVPLADSVGRLQNLHHGLIDMTKQPLSTVENQKTALGGASQEKTSSRAIQPVQGAKDFIPPLVSADSQKKKTAMDESTSQAGSSKDDARNSPGCPPGVAKASGDVGMDQQGAEVAEKHAKENHGLRLLKAAVADYVKEVLKPAWKEGNMSKEAFKSIVKKVVDKVVGSLQAHQIPKSQENVDQYMAQSQAKIAKLVQGYVDRFKKN